MTVDYTLDAMLELRKFIWSDLVTLNIFNEDDYVTSNGDEYNPIIPVQQAEALSQLLSGKKHIVYDKIGMSYEDNWLICCEQILFTIYATSVSEINQFRNYMVDRFRRMDVSARDVNEYNNVTTTVISNINLSSNPIENGDVINSITLKTGDRVLLTGQANITENGLYVVQSSGPAFKTMQSSDKFKFHSIYVADISPTSPSKEMAGFFASDIILEIKYSRITDGAGRFI